MLKESVSNPGSAGENAYSVFAASRKKAGDKDRRRYRDMRLPAAFHEEKEG